jgi:hypothetical protein
MLRKPANLDEGLAFLGTTVEESFAGLHGAAPDWCKGSILGATDKLRGSAQEGKKIFKGLFFHIRSVTDTFRCAFDDCDWQEAVLCSDDSACDCSSTVFSFQREPCAFISRAVHDMLRCGLVVAAAQMPDIR